jgi:hypothetical protein
MKLDFFCRVHTVNPEDETETKNAPPRLPPSVVALDAETVEDLALNFEFGCYTYCELVEGRYASCEQGVLFRDDLKAEFVRVIREYAQCPPVHLGEIPRSRIRVRTRTDFVKSVFWPTLRAGGAVVGLNLGFDVSRIATHYSLMRDGKSFKFFTLDYFDEETHKCKPSTVVPAIIRTSIDSKKSFYGVRFSSACKADGKPVLSNEEVEEFKKSRFLDVRTLAASLTNESHSLESLCRSVGKKRTKLEPSYLRSHESKSLFVAPI